MMCSSSVEEITFRAAFEADEDLRGFGSNDLSMFALSLYLRLEDLDEFAASAITEGPDDKKVDVCYLDEDEGRLIVAQSYVSQDWERQSALANKASDLNTAIAWLLSASSDLIPPHLQTKALEIRNALKSGSINHIEILYIHNCIEGANVQSELKTAADAARDISLSMVGDDKRDIVVSYREMGVNVIEDLYRSRDSEILVDEWIEVPLEQYVEEGCDEWRAILTTVPTNWIRRLHREHGGRLFSANYREYLGYTRREGNINYQISTTAESEPVNFWVYNNGITALTYELQLETSPRIRGISIINGAQTTGALSETTEEAAEQAKVLMRIVECRSPELVDKIIRYNNTQNEIKPADRRSKDQTQRRLAADFKRYEIDYIHRRSATRTPRNAITAAAIAPALCAFHGAPQTSYRNSKLIFNDEETYQRVFPPTIRVEHIFLVRSLSTAIDRIKSELKRKVSEETTTDLEERQYEVMKYSASKHFLFYMVGALAEEIMNRRVSDLFEWKCRKGVIAADNVSMSDAWAVSLGTLLPHIATIIERRGSDSFYDVPRSIKLSKEITGELKALIASLESSLGDRFGELRNRTVV